MTSTTPVLARAFSREVLARVGPVIIDGAAGPGSIFLLNGPEGAGKTRTALSLALALADDQQPAWGPFRLNKHGSVLYLPTDPSEAETALLLSELDAAGCDLSRLHLPEPGKMPLYRVERGQRVVPENVCAIPEDCVAVVIDTWSALLTADGAGEVYQELNTRAVIRTLRQQYPQQMLLVLNHMTDGSLNSPAHAMSPGLRRLAQTCYTVRGTQPIDEQGRWAKGALVGEGKFARSAKLYRNVALTWDSGTVLPRATVDGLSVAQLIVAWPHIPGCTTAHKSVRAALQELAAQSGKSFETLKSEQRIRPNPLLAGLAADA